MGQLGFGGKVAKYTLFCVNLVVALAGLALLIIGIFVLANSNAIHYIGIASDNSTFHLVRGAAVTVLIVGAASLVVGVIGCWGALCEKTSCLNCYACITVVLILGEIVAIILAGVYHDKIDDTIKQEMKKMLEKEYGKNMNDSLSKAWNFLQKEECCCGVYGPVDWKTSYYYVNMTQHVPYSCCLRKDDGTVKDKLLCNEQAFDGKPSSDYVYKKGCASYIEWVKGHMAVLIAFAVILLLVEVILVILTCCLRSTISRGYEYV